MTTAAQGRAYRKTQKGSDVSHAAYVRYWSDVEYDEMLARQHGLCAICQGQEIAGRRLSVEHDHETGDVRALVCNACNTALGMLREDPVRMRQLAGWITGQKKYRGTIYIAGRMRGQPLFGFPAFDAAAEQLRGDGWFVLSPAEHNRQCGFDPTQSEDMQPDFDVASAFRWDINALLYVDAVYFLDGWEASQGANTEHAIAVSIGLERLYQTPRDDQEYFYLPHVAYRKTAASVA